MKQGSTGWQDEESKLSRNPVAATSDYGNFGGGRELLMHRIRACPAKFPAFITPKAVVHARARG